VTFLRRFGLDLLIVVAAVQSAFAVALADGPNAPTAWFGPFGVGVLVLALIGRRWWPFGAPVALWLLAAALSFADGRLVVYSTTVMLAGTTAAFLLGNLPDTRQRGIGLAVLMCAAVIVSFNDPAHANGDLFLQPALFVIAWLAGYGLRGRAAQAEAAEQRAARAEHEREIATRIAVAEERARIARELHDIVAHAVSVMVLQTGAVRHRLPASEDREALVEVEKTGRAALTEMRRLLGALREDESLELAPQPGLETLDALVEAFRRSGLPVEVRVDGEQVPLPRALDLSAYRIVQEGLTNALKHARASRAEVVVRYEGDELRIEVRDDGAGGASDDGLGHGLVGIRERVKIYGGSMSAGRVNGGGFVLSTRLPLSAQ
jgi:signal transduction histidine kinase